MEDQVGSHKGNDGCAHSDEKAHQPGEELVGSCEAWSLSW